MPTFCQNKQSFHPKVKIILLHLFSHLHVYILQVYAKKKNSSTFSLLRLAGYF